MREEENTNHDTKGENLDWKKKERMRKSRGAKGEDRGWWRGRKSLNFLTVLAFNIFILLKTSSLNEWKDYFESIFF